MSGAMPLPTGFVAIQDATTAGAIVSLIGLVISVDEPRKTKGTDWALGFAIQDDFSTGSVGSACSINCRMFNKQLNKLPKLTAGDIVILRKFKLNAWNFRIDCVGDSRMACGVLVFPANKIPVPELGLPYQSGKQVLLFNPTPGARDPTIQEQIAVIDMKHASSGSGQDVQQHASAIAFKSTSKRSLALIKELRENIFSDVRAQIVNLYYNAMGVELKVTDYTANSQLFLYADPEQDSDLVVHRTWPGPYGQLTLDVRLYEPHAGWARDNLNNGDYIFMRNLHARTSRAGKLEGAMHQDRMHPSQVDISKLVNPVDIAEINQRRRLYEKQRSPKGLMLRGDATTTTSGRISSQKKQDKREKIRLEKELGLKQLEEKAKDRDAERHGINTNSQCLHVLSVQVPN
jgi:protection-of-telomeres protein 1